MLDHLVKKSQKPYKQVEDPNVQGKLHDVWKCASTIDFQLGPSSRCSDLGESRVLSKFGEINQLPCEEEAGL